MCELNGMPVAIGKGQDPHHTEVCHRAVGAASGKSPFADARTFLRQQR
jgi:hypothetical protein